MIERFKYEGIHNLGIYFRKGLFRRDSDMKEFTFKRILKAFKHEETHL